MCCAENYSKLLDRMMGGCVVGWPGGAQQASLILGMLQRGTCLPQDSHQPQQGLLSSWPPGPARGPAPLNRRHLTYGTDGRTGELQALPHATARAWDPTIPASSL